MNKVLEYSYALKCFKNHGGSMCMPVYAHECLSFVCLCTSQGYNDLAFTTV